MVVDLIIIIVMKHKQEVISHKVHCGLLCCAKLKYKELL